MEDEPMSFLGAITRRLRSMPRGGILTGSMIVREVNAGRIQISEFQRANINPNSYNLAIGNELRMYTQPEVFDLRDPETYSDLNTIIIDEKEGFVLRPGNLYLASTRERVGSDYYEPIITGRSSIGRLGISIHQEAGFADIGYHGPLTLQIKVQDLSKPEDGPGLLPHTLRQRQHAVRRKVQGPERSNREPMGMARMMR